MRYERGLNRPDPQGKRGGAKIYGAAAQPRRHLLEERLIN
jgi:hypothetical protein